ncbi:hypothetical protein B6N60_03567 [Richelia sinica FACHB-800]|uniref:Uncharacterized protein n=1 Tax=Richelia sinica FACHB-800 TaxID=1357546 RepID=A0A975TB89_9NOST|nr:molecular chaperone DnaJ [Richelia sinica]MBD2667101.1 molecular chaperone DnaJ [Richelia sinica FACHB-800]QXE24857.1 hypothetical protein B6N60_03567 [Richelia sinica FACHB-800]
MQNNPYDILGVSPAASKVEITKAVALAMKRKEYPVDVIARAQKSLMKPEERIIADYLRPILPTIKRFKASDLSALGQTAPNLQLLPQFDDLDQAIAQAEHHERLEREPLPIPVPQLLKKGIAACKDKRYPKAIKYLEDFCHNCQDPTSADYAQGKIWLIKAYQMVGQLQRAIALCQELSNHSHPQAKTWAQHILPKLSQEISRV